MQDILKYIKSKFIKRSKVFIPFSDFTFVGGPSTFMQNLKTYMDTNKFPYTQDLNKLSEVSSIFFPNEFYEDKLKDAKSKSIKIIQRVAGVYHPIEHGEDYRKLNANLEFIYKNLADIVVFQGEYSKKQFFEMFGEKTANQYRTIVNGVDKNIFFPPKNPKKDLTKIKFVITGNFRKKVMIEPVIKALDELKDKYEIELKIVGPIQNDSLKSFFEREYINYLGVKTIEEIAEILRDSDIFIHSKINDICPNSVLEALSVGLPVVGFNSGGLKELVGFSPDLLAYVSEDLFQVEKDFDYTKLKEKLALCIDDFSKYKAIAMQNAHLYNFQDCAKGYTDIINSFNVK